MKTISNGTITVHLPDDYTPPDLGEHRQFFVEWVANLRSGRFNKGVGQLHHQLKDTYCCLGVGCKMQGRLVDGTDNHAEGPEGGSNIETLAADNPLHPFLGQNGSFPGPVYVSPSKLGARFVPSFGCLATLNDKSSTFEHVAFAIEVVWLGLHR